MSPFTMVNRPERGGAHDFEAMVLDLIDACHYRDPVRFSEWCLAAQAAGVTLQAYIGGRVVQIMRKIEVVYVQEVQVPEYVDISVEVELETP